MTTEQNLSDQVSVKSRGLSEIFTDYYRSNSWGDDETVSGVGSRLNSTINLRTQLPSLFEQFEIKSILDAPCGDHNWFSHVQRGETKYLGVDIVPELIEQNRQRYGGPNTDFVNLDITRDPLPPADLMICRDLLAHLSFKDIGRIFNNILSSDIKYLLLTHHHECTGNNDAYSGGYRPLNLELFPFDFPEPILAIDDWRADQTPRKMCLWETSQCTDEIREMTATLTKILSHVTG
ncbi:MAG TPA: class I SAM-dependent methyltransferase [Pyrinomonadaceae bacterium]|nr:class I SAM-dependent methyltransferase [Pyrinomonadaceae bacterium]